MSSFFKTAGKQISDVRGFLKEASSSNQLKYKAEKNARHMIYIPYRETETVDEAGNTVKSREIVAYSGAIHGWTTSDGRYHSTICLKDVVRHSEQDPNVVLNDGSCPFCNRVSDSWDIYNYRMQEERDTCNLTGENLEKHMEAVKSQFFKEIKTNEPATYLYILIAQFRKDAANNLVIENGLPTFDLKIFKASANTIKKIQEQLENSSIPLPGAEVVFSYSDTEDPRLLANSRTISPLFGQALTTVKYPEVVNEINRAVDKFEWSELENTFTEWKGMTSTEAKTQCDEMFRNWDNYKQEKLVNPNAKYLENVSSTPMTQPQLTSVINQPVDNMTGVQGVPQVTNTPPTGAVGMATPDANAIFGAADTLPNINI